MHSGFSTRLNVKDGDESATLREVGWWMRSASPLGKLSPQANEGVSTSSDA